ncbi:hypothetical protein [Ottowia thiooxydans]|uniref:hypothetical protein n=1 Tax=Ottowia thiooxydans TaxID=219182 RepID=UPI000421CD84|nr:hypothetical protein [Ottowia thiooxydans]
MKVEAVLVSSRVSGDELPETREEDERAAERMSDLSRMASAAHEQAITEIEARAR